MSSVSRVTASIIGSPIDVIAWPALVDRIKSWAKNHESRVVCICNVHSVVTAALDPDFHKVLEDADTATPDGAPVAWMIRRELGNHQQRINGPDLLLRFCEVAAKDGISVFFYGSTWHTLSLLTNKLKLLFPELSIAGTHSPVFGPLKEESSAIIEEINSSGAGVVWVSLGCPKQEKWMALHKGKINAVMVGVGAAFEYHAGTVKRAPGWMQHSGLEWVFRLFQEPRRLWKRYLVTNSIFVYRAVIQLIMH